MLKGKTALITGSTSGIGLGIALALAREGANIVINGVGAPDEISRVEGELKSHNIRTLYHDADMSQPTAIEAMIGAAESSFGQIDAIIAINLSSAFHSTPHASEDEAAQLGAQDDAQKALLAEKQPSLQFVTPEQLGALAVFLCMPAADQIRGAAWNVDGGWYAQ